MSVAGTRFGHLTRAARCHIPVIPASPHEQLRHNILSLVRSTFMADQDLFKPKEVKGLKKIPPYWYPYTTMTKQRWIGRELLEVVSTEFRDRSMEYYVSLFTFCLIRSHKCPRNSPCNLVSQPSMEKSHGQILFLKTATVLSMRDSCHEDPVF